MVERDRLLAGLFLARTHISPSGGRFCGTQNTAQLDFVAEHNGLAATDRLGYDGCPCLPLIIGWIRPELCGDAHGSEAIMRMFSLDEPRNRLLR